MQFFMPDFALPVKELSNEGSLLANVWEVDESACSQALERFNNVSPNSRPH